MQKATAMSRRKYTGFLTALHPAGSSQEGEHLDEPFGLPLIS
jgi:hypothetical protein